MVLINMFGLSLQVWFLCLNKTDVDILNHYSMHFFRMRESQLSLLALKDFSLFLAEIQCLRPGEGGMTGELRKGRPGAWRRDTRTGK